jgi:hypothetical protein
MLPRKKSSSLANGSKSGIPAAAATAAKPASKSIGGRRIARLPMICCANRTCATSLPAMLRIIPSRIGLENRTLPPPLTDAPWLVPNTWSAVTPTDLRR